MKKFSFSLDTVLDYKGQVLESKQNEHGKAMAAQNEQEKIIIKLKSQYHTYKEELNEKRKQGLTVIEAISYESYMNHLDSMIRIENEKLEDLKEYQEQKRGEVVEAKKETSTIEKLKDKKKKEYDKIFLKKDELFIEEFVSNSMASGKNWKTS